MNKSDPIDKVVLMDDLKTNIHLTDASSNLTAEKKYEQKSQFVDLQAGKIIEEILAAVLAVEGGTTKYWLRYSILTYLTNNLEHPYRHPLNCVYPSHKILKHTDFCDYGKAKNWKRSRSTITFVRRCKWAN